MQWPNFSQRSTADELMDDLAINGPELSQALHQLRWINRLLGGTYPTSEGVMRLWNASGRPARLHVLDVGAGAGDHSKQLLRWAERKGIDIHITLLDIHPQTCDLARQYYTNEPRISVQQGDLFSLKASTADIITAALVLHHMPDSQLGTALLVLRQAARLGVVVNDLHRHAFAWASIWVLTHLLSSNRMIRHDAQLSVLRGFQAADLRRLARLPGLDGLCFQWRPMFRYLIILSTA